MEDTSTLFDVANAAMAAEGLSTASWEVVVVRLIVCAIFALIAYVVYRVIMIPVNRLLVENDKTRRGGGSIIKNIVRGACAIWAICCILDMAFGINMAGILGALGIVGVAVSLGAQQTIANLIGGILISLSKTFAPGDWVVIGGSKEAEIKDTNWRDTTLVDEDGVSYVVPNSKMVSEIVVKKLPFYTIVVPFSLKTTVPDIGGLLAECEQVLLDRQVELGMDYEAMRPKAHVSGASLGTVQAEVKLYVSRDFDTRSAERAILPAVIAYLQEKDALAEVSVAQD